MRGARYSQISSIGLEINEYRNLKLTGATKNLGQKLAHFLYIWLLKTLLWIIKYDLKRSMYLPHRIEPMRKSVFVHVERKKDS